MPIWSTTPPDTDDDFAIRITRTPPKGTLSGILTTPNLIGCPTHYVNGRTLPCQGPRCTACPKGFPSRWHGYLGLYLPKTAEHTLLEITKHASLAVADHRRDIGPLRGKRLDAHRADPRINARVILRITPFDAAQIALPAPPDVIACLAKIWGIPESEMHRDDTTQTIESLRIHTAENNGRLSQPIIPE